MSILSVGAKEDVSKLISYAFENDVFVFNENLEDFLCSKGVKQEHIARMKETILQASRSEYYNYPTIGSAERDYDTLVPLEKVIGTSRGTVGASVFDNVREMRSSEREPGRFVECLRYLEIMSLDELQRSFENLHEPVVMEHYIDDDTYFLTRDGNHRTLVAMLIGADKIRALVTDAHCDEKKKKSYLIYRDFLHNIGAKRLEISASGNGYSVVFIEDNQEYVVDGYQSQKPSEPVDVYLRMLSVQIAEDRKTAEKIGTLPEWLKSIRLMFVDRRNKRIRQYVDKHYIDECTREHVREYRWDV